ncbi:hypothetical protein [Paraurantiacibacter namhicola]|uniref:Lipoprotein n=1 Tax=Paraurantiacibacter namhicola TaxID=645517 RepID=A0A1C7D7C2_9SPHN|nr:hypothetical protein [Paraurantiacibacter namhicola]ANU07345.1 hypothetical protein A6F65_01036 [Paraurantiacibacter namhicola]
MSEVSKCVLAVSALALAACGNSDATASEEPAPAAGASAAEASPPATPAAGPAEKPLIPRRFQGQFDYNSSTACQNPDTFMSIGPDWISRQGGAPEAVVTAQDVGGNSVELEYAPDPEYPGEDQRFGLTLSANGQNLTVSFPQMSGMNYVRCAGKPRSKAELERLQAEADSGIPAKYRGRWSVESEAACTANDIDDIVVEKDRVRLQDGAVTKLSDFERIDNYNYQATGAYTTSDFEGEPFKLTLRIRGEGTVLVYDMWEQGTTVYDRRCD